MPLSLVSQPGGLIADNHLAVLFDREGRLSLEQVRGRVFAPLAGQAGFGFTDDVIWLRLEVEALERAPWWLEVAFTSLDDVRLYAPDASGLYVEQRAGDHLPFAARPIEHRHFVFPLDLPGRGLHTLYLRIQTADSLVAPIRLWAPEAFRLRQVHENLLLGISYGAILAMLIYNAFLWSVLRERIYGYYVLSTLTSLLIVIELNGHAFQYLWPDNLWLADHQHVLVPAAHYIAISLWTRRFLGTSRRAPWCDRAITLILAGAAMMIGLSCIGQYRLGNQLAFWVGLVMIPTLIIAATRAMLLGYRPARLFLLAQVFPLVGALATVLRALGLLPDTLFSEHGLQLGVTIEVLLFSLALAQRIEALRQEKAEALQRAETDPLTGVYNRAGFELRMQAALDEPAHQPLALLLIDLDHFKPVNDQLGHAAGDVVLRATAERLRQHVRAGSDIVARIGGDEFAITLTDLRASHDAERVASKIIATLTQAIHTATGTAHVGASIGIALAPAHGLDTASLMNAADTALYEAKRAGRNRWHCAPIPEGPPPAAAGAS